MIQCLYGWYFSFTVQSSFALSYFWSSICSLHNCQNQKTDFKNQIICNLIRHLIFILHRNFSLCLFSSYKCAYIICVCSLIQKNCIIPYSLFWSLLDYNPSLSLLVNIIILIYDDNIVFHVSVFITRSPINRHFVSFHFLAIFLCVWPIISLGSITRNRIAGSEYLYISQSFC